MELNIVKDVIVPIFIGVLSSALFLLLASRIKPRLSISSQIAKMPPSGCVRPEVGYAVKVVNKSKRTATEVKARLAVVRKLTVAGGQINQTDDFVLIKDFLFELPGCKDSDLEDSAFRFITYQLIEQDWENSNYILFSVSAKDSLSGFGKVFSQAYYLKREALQGGTFEIGHSMRIV